MEKRNYLKPEIKCNNVKTASLIAASGNQITVQEFEDKLEACLQFPDYESSKGETSVTAFLEAYPGGSGCFKQEYSDAEDGYDCLGYLQSLDSSITSNSNVHISYSNGIYTISKATNNNCSSTWNPGKH